LKTVIPPGIVGSNPTPSATKLHTDSNDEIKDGVKLERTGHE
jgi:hypothetical protein